jgi:predicted membrane chloride channel (bestrophin family)
MISYNRSAFGLNLLFRIHGSAIYRSVIPGLFGIAFFLFFRYFYRSDDDYTKPEPDHPAVIGVVVSGITFLIIFRANQGYSRYWEATSAIYTMQSKWMDATIHTATYHLQSDRYDHLKPPSFYDYPGLDSLYLTRDRERVRYSHMDHGTGGIMHHQRAVAKSIVAVTEPDKKNESLRAMKWNQSSQSSRRFESASSAQNVYHHPGSSNNPNPNQNNPEEEAAASPPQQSPVSPTILHDMTSSGREHPRFLTGRARMDGNWSKLFPDGKSTFYDPRLKDIPRDPRGFASTKGGRTPPLFLQELAHLSSLMTAVALSTLRNDVDGAESPLDYYEPGSPWPKVDPGDIPELYGGRVPRFWAGFLFFLGMGRSPEQRTRYNASRPLPVIGGVSDAEVRFLQLARGPYAKTQLCWSWISEFITREHLTGSLGKVGAPIISRVVQFLGDGMVQYNVARKIMFIPFPFAHAQLSATFVLVVIPLLAFLMDQYTGTEEVWLGCILTFLSVVCLSGIHEVARELENPFRNVPNELPVVTLMAEFNEALMIMYAGYHPDFFWEAPATTAMPVFPSSSASLDSVIETSEGDYSSDGSGDLLIERGILPADKKEAVVPSASSDTEEKKEELSSLRTNNLGDEASAAKQQQQDSSSSLEVDQLRAIVEQQGRFMEKMMEEQTRLNKMIQAAFANADRKKES